MSVRSGDKCLTGIKAWATICPCNLNLSYFLAKKGCLLSLRLRKGVQFHGSYTWSKKPGQKKSGTRVRGGVWFLWPFPKQPPLVNQKFNRVIADFNSSRVPSIRTIWELPHLSGS